MKAAVFREAGKKLSIEELPEAFEALEQPTSQCKVVLEL